MKCQDDFLLTVEASGLDWNLLIWDIANFVPGFDGSSTGTLVGGHGNGVVIAASNNGPGNPARVEAHASLLYTGPLVNCKLTLNAAIYADVTSAFGIHVLQDGIEVVAVGQLPSPNDQPAPGVYPFTIAVGVNSLIEVEGNIPAIGKYLAVATNLGVAAVSFDFQLTNV